jgi:hypothetical protein
MRSRGAGVVYGLCFCLPAPHTTLLSCITASPSICTSAGRQQQ